jgi:hypothetical protein
LKQLIEDGSAEQFLQNNSIADFMRFKKDGVDGGTAELQTAVVSYRKRFPWSLLQPFLQVQDGFFLFFGKWMCLFLIWVFVFNSEILVVLVV